jgi:hypothetical protein
VDDDNNNEKNREVDDRHGDENSVFHCRGDNVPVVITLPKKKKVSYSFSILNQL